MFRNFLIGQPIGDQLQHLKLTLCQFFSSYRLRQALRNLR